MCVNGWLHLQQTTTNTLYYCWNTTTKRYRTPSRKTETRLHMGASLHAHSCSASIFIRQEGNEWAEQTVLDLVSVHRLQPTDLSFYELWNKLSKLDRRHPWCIYAIEGSHASRTMLRSRVTRSWRQLAKERDALGCSFIFLLRKFKKNKNAMLQNC